MAFVIVSETSKRIVAGSFKEEVFFYVADDSNGQLVGRKAHATKEEAEAELAGMSGLLEGLEFARAQFPKLGDKAHVGKANVIAEYLTWVAQGKPVKTVEQADAESVEAPAEEVSADETF